FCRLTRRPPLSTLFPYTTLFRSLLVLHWLRASTDLVRTSVWVAICGTVWLSTTFLLAPNVRSLFSDRIIHLHAWATFVLLSIVVDRKSTRLNSSHVKISYAVFCL